MGKGTEFIIYLPATVSCSETVCPAAAETVVDPRGKQILVMDDEEIVLKTLASMLEELKYGYDLVSDGDEAVEKYRQKLESGDKYDILILDLTIPGGMGGSEAAERIKAIDSQACLVASSGYTDGPVMSGYKKHGFCGILKKPYTIDDLRAVLNKVSAEKKAE